MALGAAIAPTAATAVTRAAPRNARARLMRFPTRFGVRDRIRAGTSFELRAAPYLLSHVSADNMNDQIAIRFRPNKCRCTGWAGPQRTASYFLQDGKQC